jgi:hypothetical protein
VKIRVQFEDNNILEVQCVVTFSNVLIYINLDKTNKQNEFQESYAMFFFLNFVMLLNWFIVHRHI